MVARILGLWAALFLIAGCGTYLDSNKNISVKVSQASSWPYVGVSETGSLSYSVTNFGGLSPNDFAISGLDSPFFVADENCSSSAIKLGDSCEIEVNFSPTSVGDFEDELVITPSKSVEAIQISVSAEATLNWRAFEREYWPDFEDELNYVTSQGATGGATFAELTDPGITSTAEAKWIQFTLGPDGNIYGIPAASDQVLVVNPIDDTISFFGSLGTTSNAKWDAAVLADNGKIYGIPYQDSSAILEIDPETKQTTTFGSVAGSNAKYSSAAIGGNGKIYSCPLRATQFLEVDPETKTINQFGSSPGTYDYIGAVSAPNGKVYCIPYNESAILEINPETLSTTTFGSITGRYKSGPVLPSGEILAIPLSHTSSQEIIRFDPDTKTFSNFGIIPAGTFRWGKGCLAPSGLIYSAPRNDQNILEIDPSTDALSFIDTGDTATNKWGNCVTAPNGKIYATASHADSVLVIDPKGVELFDINLLLSRFLNSL